MDHPAKGKILSSELIANHLYTSLGMGVNIEHFMGLFVFNIVHMYLGGDYLHSMMLVARLIEVCIYSYCTVSRRMA